MPILHLPAIPGELKSVTPYLQRTDELKSKDPIMAYWCACLLRDTSISRLISLLLFTGAYYAAQLGIGMKLKDHAARTFLFDLLSLLERMKADIGQTDAIDDDAACAAYVENFALKVFAMADNEDRRGNATRCVPSPNFTVITLAHASPQHHDC